MTDPFDRIRRPEYTGENRCWPCTLANSFLLGVLVGVAARRGRRAVAAAIAVVGVAAIALRGYVVPYTPRVAPRLVAALPIDPFDHGDGEGPGSLSGAIAAPDDTADAAAPNGETVLTELLEAGVVVPEDEDLHLSADFRDEWRREMRRLRESDLEALAAIADDLTPSTIEPRVTRTWGRPVLVLDGDGGTPATLRRGVAVAELAAAQALESRVDDPAVRRAAGRPLRSMLADCPLCDAALTVTQTTCCGETTPIGRTPSEKLVCPDCNERFFVFDEA